MAARTTSAVKHIYGTWAQPTERYNNVASRPSSSESNSIVTNDTFFALPWVREGSIAVWPLANTGAGPEVMPCFLQEDAVNDLALHPFNQSLLATVSNDCGRLWTVPEGGNLDEDEELTLADFEGHTKRQLGVEFHPQADNVMVTWAADKNIILWDLADSSAPQEACSVEGVHSGMITSVVWDYAGARMVTMCKDKNMRLIDPRGGEVIAEVADHQGAKGARAVWLGNTEFFATCGFTKKVEREIHLYDARSPDAPLSVTKLDKSPSAMLPIYDEDISLLYLAARGDGAIRLFEFTDENELSLIGDTKSAEPCVGIARLPKTLLDTSTVEVGRFLVLQNSQVTPIRYQIPRANSEFAFQDDLYPLTRSPNEAAIDSGAWFGGENADPVLVSLKPDDA